MVSDRRGDGHATDRFGGGWPNGMVGRHWGLTHDPFGPGAGPFVATPVHGEAAARLAHAIEAGERSVLLRAGEGLGKSRILAEALDRSRGPGRRIARVAGPVDGAAMLAGLAAGLGARVPAGANRATAWRALGDAARVCRWLGEAVVLAIDDCHLLNDPADRLDLERLSSLDSHPSARVTTVFVGREDEASGPGPSPWGLAVRLVPLSRSETASYLDAKVAAAGRAGATFTPRAVTRLHALGGGVPRGLDRLASLALMAGALRGLEVVTPDVVDGAARECAGAA